MDSCHTEVCTSTDTGGAINNNESNINGALNSELNDNHVAKANVVHAKEMFSNYFANDEQVQDISERAVLDDECYDMSEGWLLDRIKIPVSECTDFVSAAEQLEKDDSNDWESEDCAFDRENLVTVINEQHITADLTSFMKISCSDCELDNSNSKTCQGELSLQCLKCNEKFYHRFWAIRHLDFCQSSDDESDRSLKPLDFICEICEKKFQRINQLKIHLQYCVRSSASRHLEKYTHSEEALALVNYLSNTSQVLEESIKKFGHQRFYAHFCTNCFKSIVDEASVNPVDCNECKAMCLLQCRTCKCLHETYESIIEHLKSSFCGYLMQFFGDSSSQICEQQTSKLATVQQQEDCKKRKQKRKSKKTSKTKTAIKSTVRVFCPHCTASKMNHKKGSITCQKCKTCLIYRCCKCNTDFLTPKAQDLHKKSCEKLHQSKNYHPCPKCGKTFARTKNLKMHERFCTQDQTAVEDPISKEREQINIAVA